MTNTDIDPARDTSTDLVAPINGADRYYEPGDETKPSFPTLCGFGIGDRGAEKTTLHPVVDVYRFVSDTPSKLDRQPAYVERVRKSVKFVERTGDSAQ